MYVFMHVYMYVADSSGLRVCNREVAVDSSLGKTVYLKVQDEKEAMKRDMGVAHTDVDIEVGEEEDGEEEGEDDEGEDGEGEEGQEEEGEEGGEEEEVGEGDDNFDETEELGDEGEVEEEGEEEEDRTDDVEKGCTVFVRYVRNMNGLRSLLLSLISLYFLLSFFLLSLQLLYCYYYDNDDYYYHCYHYHYYYCNPLHFYC